MSETQRQKRAAYLAKLWCESRHDCGLYSESDSYFEGYEVGFREGSLEFMKFVAEEMKLSQEGFYKKMLDRFQQREGLLLKGGS